MLELQRTADGVTEKGDACGDEQEGSEDVSGNDPSKSEGGERHGEEQNRQRVIEASQLHTLLLPSFRTEERLRDTDEQIEFALRGQSDNLDQQESR